MDTLQQRRAGFAEMMTRKIPAGVLTHPTKLGGRPALELTHQGQDDDARLLYLHGGGYIVGSPDTHAGLTATIALQAGIPAVSVDYRLAPEHPFPAATDDSLAAYRELLDSVPSQKIVIAGDSAGGALTIATLIGARNAGLPMPAAAVVFSPFTDLTLSGASIETKDGIDPIFTRAALEPFVEFYLGAQDPRNDLVSAFQADLKGLPPLLIQVGSSEVLLDDAIRLAARAGSDEVEVTLEIVPRATHVFQNQFGDRGPADAALERVGRFLRAELG